MTERIFNFHQDPGHGWLEISEEDLADVSLKSTDFSSCSYRSDLTSFLYLEEDCDLPKFLKAYKNKYGSYPKLIDVCSNNESFIRNLPSIGS